MVRRISVISIQGLLALSSSVLITLICQPLFVWQLRTLDTVKLLGLTHDQVVSNYNVLLHYLLNPFELTLRMPDIASSAQGLFHFHEVKQLFLLNNSVLIVTAITWYVMKYTRFDQKDVVTLYEWYTQLKWVPICIAVVGSVSFSGAFVWFHEIVFRNDAWVFDPLTDPIILVLPETFFLLCFVAVIIMIQAWQLYWQNYYSRRCHHSH